MPSTPLPPQQYPAWVWALVALAALAATLVMTAAWYIDQELGRCPAGTTGGGLSGCMPDD